MRHQDRDPGQETEHSDEVDEVAEYGVRCCVNAEEGEEAESNGERKCIDGHATLVGVCENLGALPS